MLFRGKYIVGHILVIIIVISCFLLSSWQFSRLSERKELNSRIENKMSIKSVSLASIAHVKISKQEIKNLEYRRVFVEGKFDPSKQILISGRSRDGSPGYNVVTLLNINNSNDSIFVNRGWIPQTLGDDLRSGKADNDFITPKGGFEKERKVEGIIRLNENKVLFEKDKQIDNKKVATRIDINNFKDIVGSGSVYPIFIQELSENLTSEGEFPKQLEKPELSQRNHLSYALQWIAFGIIAIVTWAIICRKALLKERRKAGANITTPSNEENKTSV